jgi:signal transduction histidine kinase
VSVRLRLAAWFVLVMAVLVVATSAITYAIVRSDLRGEAHRSAKRLARTAARGQPNELRLDGIAAPGDRIWLTGPTGLVVNSTTGAPGHTLAGVRRALQRAPAGSTSARVDRADGGQAIVLLANRGVASTLDTLLRTLVAVGVGILVAAGLMGAFLARRALRPVDRMRQQVDDIPGDELDRRITEGRPDELGRLAHAFNRLLERAEHAAEQQQQFVADASHELKTPLTALQGHARILARSVEREEWDLVQESATVIGHETRRVAATVAELLLLAEAGSPAMRTVPVRLDVIAAEACDEMRALDPERPLEQSLAPTTVSGDGRRLGELVRVLIDNALKYSPPGSAVTVSVNDLAGPTLTVRDRGRGLTPQDRERAFDRFYRGSAAGGVSGSGLGLAIAQAICDRHRAVLTLEPAPGGGTLAAVRFPPAEPGEGASGAG